MATKKFNPLEDPPPASSSDEDEVETLSGEDEEEEEEQISDGSSSEEEEEEDNLMNPINIPPSAKPKPPSGSKRQSVLDWFIARTERMENEREGVCVPLPEDKEIEKKPIKEKESPAVKSGKKRPSESTSLNAKRSKKDSEETKKPALFQRVWSEEDEISLLQGMIDYKAETGDSPYEDMDGFYEFTRKDISFEASKNQFMDKIRYLKKKYMWKVGKGVESLKKAHDIECLKLFECIWGSNGIALESAVKYGVKKSERKKKLVKSLGKDVEEEVVGFESVVESNGITKKSEKKPISLEDNGDKVEEEIVALESAVKSGVKKTEKKKKLVKPHGKEVEEEVVGFESVVESNGITKNSEKKPISLEDNGDKVEEEIVALESAVKSGVKKTEKKKLVKPHGKEVEEEVVGFESVAKSNGTTKKSEKKPISMEDNGDKVEEEVVALESAAKSNVTPKKSKKKPISLEANGDNKEEDKEVFVNVEEYREVLVNGEKVEEDREVLVNGKKVEEDKEVLVSGGVSKSLGVKASDWFEDSFLVGSITSLGVSEQFVKQKWSMVGVETKKRMEEKWKLLQAKEMDLVLEKTDFMREVGSEIAEAS